MYDIVIKNGKIIDGTGCPSYFADVAVSDGKIVRIAKNITGGKQVIDAKGLVVTPGFIDSHAHNDYAVLTFPDQIEKIEQGITTAIAGQCGDTLAPIGKDIAEEPAKDVAGFGKNTEVYRTMGSLLDVAKNVPQGANIMTFVGHGAIRRAVMGMENREPSAVELEEMKNLLREAMEHGALGVSFGLIYPPGCYAKTDELVEMAKIAAEYGGLASAHVRNEAYFSAKAIGEMIYVFKTAGVRGVLSHHKAQYHENWSKVKHTLRMIDEANEEGYDVYCDVYPYNASATKLSPVVLPKYYHTEGTPGIIKRLADPELRQKAKDFVHETFGDDLSWILITSCGAYPEYEGKTIPEIAKMHGTDQCDAMFDMITESKDVCSACYFSMCEEDVMTVLAHPRAMICTDSGVAGNNKVYHPRLRAAFPRVLGKYVREEKVTSLTEMIRKMTSMPASVYGLAGKGILTEGFDADICIFDAEKIIDNATYVDCSKRADGLSYVILNGQIVVENAVYNGRKMGRVLLRRA